MESNGTVTISISEYDRLRQLEKLITDGNTFHWELRTYYGNGDYYTTFYQYVFDDNNFKIKMEKKLEEYNKAILLFDTFKKFIELLREASVSRYKWASLRKLYIAKYSKYEI